METKSNEIWMFNKVLHKERNLGIDLGRLLGCYSIILLHQTGQQYGSSDWVSDLLDQGARWAVPFFFITTGYLLPTNTAWTKLVWKYFLRLTPVFVFWCAFYVLRSPDPKTWFSGVGQIAKLIVSGGAGYHLWFLTSLGLCIAIASPFLQFGKIGLLCLLGGLCFGVALAIGPYEPLICASFENCVPLGARHGPFFGLVFLSLGAFIRSREISVSRNAGFFLLCLGILLTSAEIYGLFSAYGSHPTEHDFVVGTLPFGLGAFFLALTLTIKAPSLVWITRNLGPVSLGIYAIHIVVLDELTKFLDPNSLLDGLSISVLTMLMASVISLAASQIPIVQKVFR